MHLFAQSVRRMFEPDDTGFFCMGFNARINVTERVDACGYYLVSRYRCSSVSMLAGQIELSRFVVAVYLRFMRFVVPILHQAQHSPSFMR